MGTDPAAVAEIGIIGGSGFYDWGRESLVDREYVPVPTPFGPPSEDFLIGSMAGRRVAFLARHGRDHRFPPAKVPARANLYALRALGVRQVVSVSAVGSLREELAPGHLVLPDQLVDRTKGLRAGTFFDEGPAVHVSLADPYCHRLRDALRDAAGGTGATVHPRAVYCCMEGPQFSTRSESRRHRAEGLDLIGMTAAPETGLAREAELCFAVLALVTDYDCWHETAGDVDAGTVAEVMHRNVESAARLIETWIGAAEPAVDCSCHHALSGAILGSSPALSAMARRRVALFLDARVG